MNRKPDARQLASRQLSRILLRLRAATPRKRFGEVCAAVDASRIEAVGQHPTPRAVITLRSIGCEWTRRAGGCTMCGHLADAPGESVATADALIAQFNDAFARIDFARHPVLCLYNGGSVLARSEIPDDAFFAMVEKIAAEPRITTLALETRPEFVDSDRLKALSDALGERTLRIAMGLESADDEIRQLCIHKGLSTAVLARAAKTITRYASLRLYVMLKPLWLTEAEAIDDAVAAVDLAYKMGAEDVHIEAATVQAHTLIELLHRDGRYRLPWLWSLVELARRVEKPVYISPFAHVPTPLAIPQNCPACTATVRAALINGYNTRRDPAALETLHCECQREWEAAMRVRDPRPIVERVLHDLPYLESLLPGED